MTQVEVRLDPLGIPSDVTPQSEQDEHVHEAASAGSPYLASFMPRSNNSCNKVDASDVRASRRLVCTVARERRTFSLRDLCLWHSPHDGERHRHKSLSENVRRSRDKVRTSLRDARTSEASTLLHELCDLGVQLAAPGVHLGGTCVSHTYVRP